MDNNTNDYTQLIVIGLTGPLGSGCSTVANFFDYYKDHEKKFLKNYLAKYLVDKNYINPNIIEINFNRYDKEIANLYSKKLAIEQKLNNIENNQGNNWIEQKLESNIKNIKKIDEETKYLKLLQIKIHETLKIYLEKRETLKSLDYILYYRDYTKNKHHFRNISVSDLIIYRSILEYEKYSMKSNEEKKNSDCKFWEGCEEKKVKCKNYMENILESNLKLVTNLFESQRHKYNKPFLANFYKQLDELTLKSNNKKAEEISKILYEVISIITNIKEEFQKLKYYREIMQDFGDNLRKRGNPYDYSELTLRLNDDRTCIKDNKDRLAKDVEILINFLYKCRSHSFFIIDCLRNPYEIFYLRKKFVNFYLISLFADEKIRKKRIEEKMNNSGAHFDEKEFEKSEERDRGENISEIESMSKQNVTKCVILSDIAINNENDTDELYENLLRYLALIFDKGCTKPTSDEMYMNMAYTMAMKSNCICRQVGAVIVKNDYVVGAGFNDVGMGQISCGLREVKDLKLEDFEKYCRVLDDKNMNTSEIISQILKKYKNGGRSYFSFCFKDTKSKKTTEDKIDSIIDKFKEIHKKDNGIFENKLNELSIVLKNKLKLKALQYCKSLHAEENAIIQASKIGGMGLIGAKIYSTSFPCELCAKKIYQVGLEEVIYTEAYPGISEKMFLQDGINKVKTRHFEGVMPYAYCKLFKVNQDQKEWQNLNDLSLVE